jgi:chitinase
MQVPTQFLYTRCICAGFGFALIAIMASIALPASAQSEQNTSKRLLGYYPEWSKTQVPPYTAEQIPYTKLTHIAHAFLLLTAQADGALKIPEGMIEQELIDKAHVAGVKVLVSIGGGDGIQGPRFNKMARSEKNRQNFVFNVRDFLVTYGYDGVDIDWEIPNAEDIDNCTTLMQELRNGLPRPWLISMATTAEPASYGQGFNIPALTPIVDFFNVMTYDFYGPWSGITGLVSPLLQDPRDPELNGSVETSMDIYEKSYGVPVSKLNMGTPFYGYEWDGVDTLWTACSSCASYSWNYGTYIKQRINKLGWVNHSDPEAGGSPYLTNSTLPGFITYDGISSTDRKVRYVKSRRFGGVFTWELSADYDGKSQDLLNAMYDAWK